MTQIFESPIFSYLGQLGREVDIYPTTFNSVEVEVMGESNYLNARDAGISFALNKQLKIDAIFLYADGVEDFKQYQEDLPGGLSFDMSRAQVRKVLGEPSFSGEAGGTGIMAIKFSFDRYESDTNYIRFEYTEKDKQIRLVTMGKA
jgi:hypothetical protein